MVANAKQKEPTGECFVLIHPTENAQVTFRPNGGDSNEVVVLIRLVMPADQAHKAWYDLRDKGYERI